MFKGSTESERTITRDEDEARLQLTIELLQKRFTESTFAKKKHLDFYQRFASNSLTQVVFLMRCLEFLSSVVASLSQPALPVLQLDAS